MVELNCPSEYFFKFVSRKMNAVHCQSARLTMVTSLRVMLS